MFDLETEFKGRTPPISQKEQDANFDKLIGRYGESAFNDPADIHYCQDCESRFDYHVERTKLVSP